MARIVAEGKTLEHTPASAVAAGDVLVIGSLIGVAPQPIAAGVAGTVEYDCVAELPCATGATGAQGSAISWYAVSGVAHASTGAAAGKLAKPRLADDASVHVLLNK